MENSEFKMMVDQFYDGALDKKKERVLFELLANDEQCREYFKQSNLLKSIVNDTVEEFPVELEERILYSIGKIDEKNQKRFSFSKNIFTYLSYSFVAVLVAMTLYFYNQSNDYKLERDQAYQTIFKQADDMDTYLFQSLPEIEVVASKNEVGKIL